MFSAFSAVVSTISPMVVIRSGSVPSLKLLGNYCFNVFLHVSVHPLLDSIFVGEYQCV